MDEKQKKALQQAWADFQKYAKDAGQTISTNADEAWGSFKEWVNKQTSQPWVSDVKNTITANATDAYNTFKGWVAAASESSAGKDIGDFFKNMFDFSKWGIGNFIGAAAGFVLPMILGAGTGVSIIGLIAGLFLGGPLLGLLGIGGKDKDDQRQPQSPGNGKDGKGTQTTAVQLDPIQMPVQKVEGKFYTKNEIGVLQDPKLQEEIKSKMGTNGRFTVLGMDNGQQIVLVGGKLDDKPENKDKFLVAYAYAKDRKGAVVGKALTGGYSLRADYVKNTLTIEPINREGKPHLTPNRAELGKIMGFLSQENTSPLYASGLPSPQTPGRGTPAPDAPSPTP